MASNQWHILHNLKAGVDTVHTAWQSIAEGLKQQGMELHEIPLTSDIRIDKAIKTAIESGCRKLIVVGGDGTNHHAINGLMQQQACPSDDVSYALFPAGTGNDWVRTHRIPHSPDAWLRMFNAQQYAYQGLGKIIFQQAGKTADPHYFVNVLGMGYDAEVVRYLAEHKITQMGGLKYFAAIYACLRRFDPQRHQVRVVGQTWEHPFYSLNVGIGRYNGSGMRFVPHADPKGPEFAYTFIKRIASWRVAINTPWVYTSFFDRHPLTIAGHSAWMEVRPAADQQPVWVEADGELLGKTPVRIELLPRTLRYLSP